MNARVTAVSAAKGDTAGPWEVATTAGRFGGFGGGGGCVGNRCVELQVRFNW